MITKINKNFLDNLVKQVSKKTDVSEQEALETFHSIVNNIDSYLNKNTCQTIKIVLGNYELVAERSPEQTAINPLTGNKMIKKGQSYVSIKALEENTPDLYSDIEIYNDFSKCPSIRLRK